MNLDFSWSHADLKTAVAIGNVTIGFIAYFFISGSEKIKNNIFQKYPQRTAWIYWITFQRFSGVIFLGLLPLITTYIFLDYSASALGFTWWMGMDALKWVALLCPIIVLINFFAARKPDNLAMYPQIRINDWTWATLIGNHLSWTAYLLAYEALFRGFLLFPSYDALGLWPAVIINTSLYATVHIPKGIRETLGALVLGFVLCLITLSTGNFWVAFLVHITLALSNDSFSLKYQPMMKLK